MKYVCIHHFIVPGYAMNQFNDLPVHLLAQLVERYTGIAEASVQIPARMIFFRFSFRSSIICVFYRDLLCFYYMWLYVLRLGFLPGALLQAKLARSQPGLRWRPNKRKEVHSFQGWSSQGPMDSWYVHLWHQVHANRTDRKRTACQWGITYFTWW